MKRSGLAAIGGDVDSAEWRAAGWPGEAKSGEAKPGAVKLEEAKPEEAKLEAVITGLPERGDASGRDILQETAGHRRGSGRQ